MKQRKAVTCYVVDYEHSGDISIAMSEIHRIDPSAALLSSRVSKEDPDADCEDCELVVEVDADKAEDINGEYF